MTKTKGQTMTSVGEDSVKLGFSDSAHGMQKGTAAVENSLSLPLEVKYRIST